MRLNLTRLRSSGAARRSALRAPSALRAAARRSFVTYMKIEHLFFVRGVTPDVQRDARCGLHGFCEKSSQFTPSMVEPVVQVLVYATEGYST